MPRKPSSKPSDPDLSYVPPRLRDSVVRHLFGWLDPATGKLYVPPAMFASALPIGPFTALDRILTLGMDVHRADCRIVNGAELTACPNADPPLPVECLSCVVAIFNRFKLLPPGQTVHWVGHRAWIRNRCDCSFPDGAEQSAADNRHRGRGRQRRYDAENDQRIAHEWDCAKQAGIEKKDFARSNGRRVAERNRLLNRVRYRKNRAE